MKSEILLEIGCSDCDGRLLAEVKDGSIIVKPCEFCMENRPGKTEDYKSGFNEGRKKGRREGRKEGREIAYKEFQEIVKKNV